MKLIKTVEDRRYVLEDMDRLITMHKAEGSKIFPPSKLSKQKQEQWLNIALKRGVFYKISRQYISTDYQF